MENKEKQRAEFEELVRPVMKWMSENLHPHTKIIIEANVAELLEGDMVIQTNEYLID